MPFGATFQFNSNFLYNWIGAAGAGSLQIYVPADATPQLLIITFTQVSGTTVSAFVQHNSYTPSPADGITLQTALDVADFLLKYVDHSSDVICLSVVGGTTPLVFPTDRAALAQALIAGGYIA